MTTRSRVLAWAVFGGACVLYLLAAYYGWQTRDSPDDSGWGPTGALPVAVILASRFMFLLVGVLIATRRPGNAIAWILIAIGAVWGFSSAVATYTSYAVTVHASPTGFDRYAAAVGNIQWVPAIGLMATFLLLLFPDGHLPSRRWRWVAWLSALSITLESVITLLTPGEIQAGGNVTVTNPLGVSSMAGALNFAQAIVIPLLLVSIVASGASIVVRYRRSRGVERQQLKWLAAAAALVVVLYAVVLPVSIVVEDAHGHVPEWTRLIEVVVLLSFGLIPLSIGFAVFRYRLYDIDLIVRRTVVYSVLVAVIAGIYLSTVTVLSAVLERISGPSGALAVTISTLLAVLAFRPIQRRVQRAVDRRFARTSYDAARTLEAFSARLRQQTDLDALNAEMLGIVTHTVQPAHASLWLGDRPAETSVSRRTR